MSHSADSRHAALCPPAPPQPQKVGEGGRPPHTDPLPAGPGRKGKELTSDTDRRLQFLMDWTEVLMPESE